MLVLLVLLASGCAWVERVSLDSTGGDANETSNDPSISADGRYVAFRSIASDLVPGDNNGFGDVFVRDVQADTTTRVSVDTAGGNAYGGIVWVSQHLAQQGVMPAPEYFFSRGVWPLTVAVFATFRLFDIAKPWPVRQSQKLPGGWGVTVDDALAAIYVNVLVALVSYLRPGP